MMRVDAPVPNTPVAHAAAPVRPAQTEAKHFDADADARRAEARDASAADGFAPTNAKEPLDEALRRVDEALRPHEMALRFSRDEETKIIVVELVDTKSGETLRQMPDEAALHLAASLGKMRGLVLDRQA